MPFEAANTGSPRLHLEVKVAGVLGATRLLQSTVSKKGTTVGRTRAKRWCEGTMRFHDWVYWCLKIASLACTNAGGSDDEPRCDSGSGPYADHRQRFDSVSRRVRAVTFTIATGGSCAAG